MAYKLDSGLKVNEFKSSHTITFTLGVKFLEKVWIPLFPNYRLKGIIAILI